jgi:Ca2+-binding RTX toxin-like protein
VNLASILSRDFTPLIGGNDNITTSNGNNTIVGGIGTDTITSATGTDVIFGDNAQITFNAAGIGVLYTTIDTTNITGANDTIVAIDGAKMVFGGIGTDTITLNNGTNIVFGDNGRLERGATGLEKLMETTGYEESLGADDTITLQNGNKTVFGGFGADTVSTGNGNDSLFGDNGRITFNAAGINVRIETLDLVSRTGGNDRITALNGIKNVFGGVGDDAIRVGTGDDNLFGDNGLLLFTNTGGLTYAATTDHGLGGGDTIVAGHGNNIIFGGVAGDSISTGSGNNAALGDNGFVSLNGSGVLTQVETTSPSIGGNDSIVTGGGNDITMGGNGADSVSTGSGNDVLIGDSGRVTLHGSGRIRTAETIDLFEGANDFLDGGSGQDIIFGGHGSDVLVGNLRDDLLAGDYASVTFDDSGRVILFIRFGAGGPFDLIGRVQEELYARGEPDGSDSATSFADRIAALSPGLQTLLNNASAQVVADPGFAYAPESGAPTFTHSDASSQESGGSGDGASAGNTETGNTAGTETPAPETAGVPPEGTEAAAPITEPQGALPPDTPEASDVAAVIAARQEGEHEIGIVAQALAAAGALRTSRTGRLMDRELLAKGVRRSRGNDIAANAAEAPARDSLAAHAGHAIVRDVAETTDGAQRVQWNARAKRRAA